MSNAPRGVTLCHFLVVTVCFLDVDIFIIGGICAEVVAIKGGYP